MRIGQVLRARASRLLAVIVVPIVVSSTAVGVARADAAEVSPAAFAKAVCGAAATAAKDSRPVTNAISAAAQAYKAAPSVETATALRDAFVAGYNGFNQQGTSFISAINGAGTPTMKNGAAFVAAMISGVQSQQAEAAKLASQAAGIDVSSTGAFAAALQQLVDQAKRDGNAFRASARANPAFAHPPGALRPVVTFMTTTADTCKKS
jgi:hypothetical protein